MGRTVVNNPELDAYVASARQKHQRRKAEEQAKVDAGVASELDLVLRGKAHSSSVLKFAAGQLAELRDVLLAHEAGQDRQRAATSWLDDAPDENTQRERWQAYQLVMDSRDTIREAMRSQKRADEFFQKAVGKAALNVSEGGSHESAARYSPQTFITTFSRYHENGKATELTSLCPLTKDWRIDASGYLKRVWREVQKVREEVEENGRFWLTCFSADDWRQTAERWKKRRQRGGDDVRFMKYPLEDGRMAVIHNATDETGEAVPSDETSLKNLLFPLLMTPEGKRPSGSRGFGGHYEGMRGDGRKKQAEREGKPVEVVGQFITSGTGGLVRAAEVLDIPLSRQLKGKRELEHEDAVLALLDAGFQLKPRNVHYEGLLGLLELFVLADEDTREGESVPYSAQVLDESSIVRYTGHPIANESFQLALNVHETAENPAPIYFGGD